MHLPAIRVVLAAYRSTEGHITEEQITAAWTEYEALRGRVVDHYKIVGGSHRRRFPTREAAEAVRQALPNRRGLRVAAFDCCGKVIV